VKFLEPEAYQPLARELFDRLSSLIRQTLPAARIEHIGSSAIEGAVSNEDEYRYVKSNFIEKVLMRREILFQTAHLTAELLSAADLDLIIQLNKTCSDFFSFQNGLPPSEDDAREIFEFVPPQSHGATKLPIGIFHAERLVGVMDVLRGYRATSDWYIGFMLLAPSFRGQGFGTEIHSGFVSYARRGGTQRLLIAVLEANDSARRFWLRLGYRKVKHYPPIQFGKRLHALTEFEMIL
jgi:RimJ/RimL family protein N-acetyltransferase